MLPLQDLLPLPGNQANASLRPQAPGLEKPLNYKLKQQQDRTKFADQLQKLQSDEDLKPERSKSRPTAEPQRTTAARTDRTPEARIVEPRRKTDEKQDVTPNEENASATEVDVNQADQPEIETNSLNNQSPAPELNLLAVPEHQQAQDLEPDSDQEVPPPTSLMTALNRQTTIQQDSSESDEEDFQTVEAMLPPASLMSIWNQQTPQKQSVENESAVEPEAPESNQLDLITPVQTEQDSDLKTPNSQFQLPDVSEEQSSTDWTTAEEIPTEKSEAARPQQPVQPASNTTGPNQPDLQDQNTENLTAKQPDIRQESTAVEDEETQTNSPDQTTPTADLHKSDSVKADTPLETVRSKQENAPVESDEADSETSGVPYYASGQQQPHQLRQAHPHALVANHPGMTAGTANNEQATEQSSVSSSTNKAVKTTTEVQPKESAQQAVAPLYLSLDSKSPIISGRNLDINPKLDTTKPEMPQKLANYIYQAAETGKALKVRLNPPELGALQIEVQRHQGHTVVRLQFEKPEARALFNENLGVLQEALNQPGLRIDQLQVILNENLTEQWEQEASNTADQEDQNEQQKHESENQGQSQQDDSGKQQNEPSTNPVFSSTDITQLDIAA